MSPIQFILLLVSFLLLIFSIILESHGRIVIVGGKLFGKKNSSILTALERTKAPKNSELGHISQPVDHDKPTRYPEWLQLYYINITNYSPSGPILIFVGGESPADPRYLVQGEMAEQSVPLQAVAMFFLEHRFYGNSWPLPDASVANLKYLTMPQALGDLAKFISHIRNTYNFNDNKVILYGGSYPGSLVAYFLQFHPNLASAGVASSAPISYHFNFKEFIELAANAIKATSPLCLSILGSGVRHLNKIIQQTIYQCNFLPTTIHPQSQNCTVDLGTFPLCTPLNARNIHDVHALNAYMMEFFIYISQYNNSLPKDINLDGMCEFIIEQKEQDLEDFEILSILMTQVAPLFYNSACVDYSMEKYCWYMAQTGQEDDAVINGARQWVWQTCSDFATFPSTDGLGHPFGRVVPASHYVDVCQCMFGRQYTEPYIRLQVDKHISSFGGLRGTLRPFVVYTNGQYDPVAGLGYNKISELQSYPPNKKNVLLIVERGSHCIDLDMSLPDDSESVQNVRNQTLQILQGWLGL